jgi:ATP-dependent RNA helicase DDX27
VITTPGRIIDLVMNSRSVGIENLEMIVFDEADKLLELGFEAEIKQIMSHTHTEVQTILFSATISKEIAKLSTITSKKPIRVSADPDNVPFLLKFRKPHKSCTSKLSSLRNPQMSIVKLC